MCAISSPARWWLITCRRAGESLSRSRKQKPRFCVFEYVYFARPDSTVQGENVYAVRKRIGEELAREAPCDADIVIPVPDSGTPAAIGFAQESALPFELGIIRNHYVGRTFIAPTDDIRHMGVKLKHNANRRLIEGKKVVLIDDSIVRGTTSQKIVAMVRDAGAKEVHMRIASPPTVSGCFYGVDTPEKQKLLASRMSTEEMAAFIKVDSLSFLTIDGLYRAAGEAARNDEVPQFCDACFTGEYPTRLTDREGAGELGWRQCAGGFVSGRWPLGRDQSSRRQDRARHGCVPRHRLSRRPRLREGRSACHRAGTDGRRAGRTWTTQIRADGGFGDAGAARPERLSTHSTGWVKLFWNDGDGSMCCSPTPPY